eukprot:jgi/Mesvir1/810/Mv17400-RA.1
MSSRLFAGIPASSDRRATAIGVAANSNEGFAQPGGALQPIPRTDVQPFIFSDIKPVYKRTVFNREWTTKDISYAIYMLFMHGMCLFAPATFSASSFSVFVALYVITGMFGITLSYHRQLTHKSFKTPKWLEYIFAYCGVQALQGDPMEWVSWHRYHHKYCDTLLDPHTPYEGFWWSHAGWLMEQKCLAARVDDKSNVAELEADPFYSFIKKTYVLHPLLLAGALYAMGGFPWLVWGMAVRVCWVYHITWFVNSASHVWGDQPWNTGDISKNNWWVGILAFGEGWHNNHHAFEYSCRHGLEWWQIDMTWYLIKALEAVGLATNLRYPRQADMDKLTWPADAKAIKS